MKKEHVLLIVVILFAIILNSVPRIDYAYPRHVDEFIHFQYANHLSSSSTLYTGQEYASLEAGFHCLLAGLNSIGISYLFMFRFFSLIITLLLCLGVYIYTKRKFSTTAALFSVLFIGLLSSSSMLLGPGFFVPMAVGMSFLLIALFLIDIDSKLWIILLAASLIIHPPSGIAMLVLINIEFLFKKKDYFKNLGYQLIAFLIALPLFLPVFIKEGAGSVSRLSFHRILGYFSILDYLGWIVLLFVFFGIILCLFRKKYSLILSSLILFLLFSVGYILNLELFIPAPRILMYLFVLFAVFFGVGCNEIVDSGKIKKKKMIIAIVLTASILLFTLPIKIDSYDSFTHILQDQDIDSLTWVKENFDEDIVVLADPIMSLAVTPIAEKRVFAKSFPTSNKSYTSSAADAHYFFRNDCLNEELLEENDLFVVYGICDNENLTEIYPKVYLRDE
jgi:hypothetical protein